MKIKKYIAPTMPEAMKQIRKELGPDAVILNSKEIQQGGFIGFFKKKRIEVVAALDPMPLTSVEDKKKVSQPNNSYPIIISQEKNSSDMLLSEIKQLKKMIEIQADRGKENYPIHYQGMYQHLLDQEVEQRLAEQIIDAVIKRHEEKRISPEVETIAKATGEIMTEMLLHVSFAGVTYEKKLIQFVGPTGVGKTTTIAKIAANMILKEHKKVAFITTDTYRIAAIEQLKTYAKILSVPVEVAYSLEDYKKAVNKFYEYDIILVDTAGRNFRNQKYVNELVNSMDNELVMDTYLVLSLTAKPKDIMEIYEQFHYLSIKDVIFTKIDETRQYGSLLNIPLGKQIGIAYITDGQDVPDDLHQITPDKITKLIVGDFADA